MITDQMRQAYLLAALDPQVDGLDPMVHRNYIREKVDFAFSPMTTEEWHLMGKLDLQRRTIYNAELHRISRRRSR